ncbi:gluconeogenesis factor YvcK family protein [Lysinibacillus endophyticus]|uniref:Gluconeogenesis factor n=1 Tax=Ureibacillus endophyticus TaxID=1978490 RepID=A0A494Z151_9BACL|nr:YvcK family protein [Lysinibacillus endophyticus]MCP1145825.1 YvcK family protein [Lysinibacillus endophyticus]RKQ16252.1 YvcK family protein [Lysinibacillus endophyticus]
MKKRKPNVVVIGGGTGLSTMLRGLKTYPFNITAIVTVADDGGSSGRLRDDYDIPPPGDIRNVIAALSDTEPLVEQMFQYRFSQSVDLGGHSLGNLMLTALTDITGDFSHAIAEMSKVLKVHGKVIPAANKKVTLHAELIDGTIIEGESKIPNSHLPIKRVYLTPNNVKPLPEAIRAIANADFILVGPGSLYTSIIPNLLVQEIGQALVKAKGRRIYICNLMTQKGETIHYRATDHVQAIYDHVGMPCLDAILVNNIELPLPIKENYKEENAEPVKFDIDKLKNMGLEVIQKEIAIIQTGAVRHEAGKIAQWLYDYASNNNVKS